MKRLHDHSAADIRGLSYLHRMWTALIGEPFAQIRRLVDMYRASVDTVIPN